MCSGLSVVSLRDCRRAPCLQQCAWMTRRTLFLVVLVALGLAGLRWCFRAHEANEWDVVNYCFGVESFDPLQHRPHPPGYLLYIAFGKLLSPLFHDVHDALVAMSCISSGLAVVAILSLARLYLPPMQSWWVALAATTNPIAWRYGSVGLSGVTGLFWAPLVIWLLVAALRSSRVWTFFLASGLVGLVGGFRQDLTLFLVSPWLVVAMQPAWSVRHRWCALGLLLVGVAGWLLPTVVACGGLPQYLGASRYLAEIISRDSLLFGASLERSAAGLHRLAVAIVLGVGVVGVIGLGRLPSRWRAVGAALHRRAEAVVLLAWLVPPLAFWALLLFHKPAYLFPVLPGLLLVGILSIAGQATAGVGLRALMLVSLLLGNVLYFALPAKNDLYRVSSGYYAPHDQMPLSVRVARPWLESTYASLRAADQCTSITSAAIAELVRATPSLAVVVLPNSPFDLRVAMWALPGLPVYELEGRIGNWTRVSRGQGGEWHALPTDQPLVVGDVDRVVWVASHDEAIASALISQGGERVAAAPGVRLVLTDPGSFDLR